MLFFGKFKVIFKNWPTCSFQWDIFTFWLVKWRLASWCLGCRQRLANRLCTHQAACRVNLDHWSCFQNQGSTSCRWEALLPKSGGTWRSGSWCWRWLGLGCRVFLFGWCTGTSAEERLGTDSFWLLPSASPAKMGLVRNFGIQINKEWKILWLYSEVINK